MGYDLGTWPAKRSYERTNKEGLLWVEWMFAAGYSLKQWQATYRPSTFNPFNPREDGEERYPDGELPSAIDCQLKRIFAPKEYRKERKAWLAGEDPTEWRATKVTKRYDE